MLGFESSLTGFTSTTTLLLAKFRKVNACASHRVEDLIEFTLDYGIFWTSWVSGALAVVFIPTLTKRAFNRLTHVFLC